MATEEEERYADGDGKAHGQDVHLRGGLGHETHRDGDEQERPRIGKEIVSALSNRPRKTVIETEMMPRDA